MLCTSISSPVRLLSEEGEPIMSSPEAVRELPLLQCVLQVLTGKWITQAISVAATSAL